MSQIHIVFFALYSRVKSGLLAVVVLRRRNLKSHMSFPLLFSNTIPHSHRSLCQTISPRPVRFLRTSDCHDHYCSLMPRQVLAVCQDLASSNNMFYDFISFVTYSTASILNQSSRYFPRSCLHHLL